MNRPCIESSMSACINAPGTHPTMATESVFLTVVVDVMQGRDVAIIDVPGAFMQADIDDSVHVRVTGKMVDLLLDVDPELFGP